MACSLVSGLNIKVTHNYISIILYHCKSDIMAHDRQEEKTWKSFHTVAVLTRVSDVMNEPSSVCLFGTLARAFVFSELDECCICLTNLSLTLDYH